MSKETASWPKAKVTENKLVAKTLRLTKNFSELLDLLQNKLTDFLKVNWHFKTKQPQRLAGSRGPTPECQMKSWQLSHPVCFHWWWDCQVWVTGGSNLSPYWGRRPDLHFKGETSSTQIGWRSVVVRFSIITVAMFQNAIILIKSCPVWPHYGEDGCTKKYTMNLHFHLACCHYTSI